MSDSVNHLQWIVDIVQRCSAEPPDADLLLIYVSEFANLTGPEKRDVFIYLLGCVSNNNDKDSNDE